MAATAQVGIKTLFSPFDDTAAEFLAFVQGAKRSLCVVIYGFHLPPLTDALIAKHKAGLEVAVILDHSQAAGKAESSEVQRLIDAGVPLLIGTSPVHGQILHSKFTVRDAVAVEFGSWNYSLSASQQSNTMSFVSDAGYAREFERHFDRVRSFIVMHEAFMQPKGEVIPAMALPGDVVPTIPASSEPSAPASQG